MRILAALFVVCAQILFNSAFCAITNRIEITRTCSKCKGKGIVYVFNMCGNCNGSGLITRESRTSLHGYKEFNSFACPSCCSSVKRGFIRQRENCPDCNGTGKVGTGEFKTVVQYSKEENDKSRMDKMKKHVSLVEKRNKLLIERQRRLDRIITLKSLIENYERQWKKLILKDNTQENINRKMTLRKLIKECQDELCELEGK